METKQFTIGHQGLLIFGIILLLIGLIASFYTEVKTYTDYFGETWEVYRTYPYQGLGIVLVLTGIILVVIGFLYSQKKR
jgi:vacuolar-type H+-ATPase subunit I/STV1